MQKEQRRMMGAKGFQEGGGGILGAFTVSVQLQEDWRSRFWLRGKQEEKHRQAHDEGAVLLLTLTSQKALEDSFFLLLFPGV